MNHCKLLSHVNGLYANSSRGSTAVQGIPPTLLIDSDLGFSLFNLASPPFSPLSMAQYSLFNYELVKNEKNRSEKGTQRNT